MTQLLLNCFGASLVGLAGLLVFVALLEVVELLQMMTMHRLEKPAATGPRAHTIHKLSVSIHMPVHNEPPDIVIRSLRSLLNLDWQNYEVVVIDNNTADPAIWRPVERFCALRPDVLRFHHVEGLTGFKAGALNLALAHTDPGADLVTIVDADYEVSQQFLRELVPLFADDRVTFIQAPQDYHVECAPAWQRCAYAEYGRFFAMGMVVRAPHNGLHMHGTLVLIRRPILDEAGGWETACVTEDCELGIRLLAKGATGVYVQRSLGRGLLPFRFDDYLAQRRRWVTGGVQAIRIHQRLLCSGTSKVGQLTLAQRLCFAQGWFPWFRDFLLCLGALTLAIGVCVAAFQPSLAWRVDTLARGAVLTVLIVAAKDAVVLMVHMGTRPAIAGGSILVILSLIPTIGRAWAVAWTRQDPIFRRTPKFREGRKVRWSAFAADLFVVIGASLSITGLAPPEVTLSWATQSATWIVGGIAALRISLATEAMTRGR